MGQTISKNWTWRYSYMSGQQRLESHLPILEKNTERAVVRYKSDFSTCLTHYGFYMNNDREKLCKNQIGLVYLSHSVATLPLEIPKFRSRCPLKFG